MTSKFKVGDKVRGDNDYYGVTDRNMTMAEVTRVSDSGDYIDVKVLSHVDSEYIGETFMSLNTKYFKLVKDFTKADLKEGDIVTLRNGKVGLYSEDMSIDGLTIFNIEDDLTNNGSCKEELDIVKVERPVSYTTVYEREENAKEMTLKEICEALGYEVKIVKEDN